ncbi:hypothetical protein [Actinomadura opuntiae]|uniref:hypothetical protein n=1 Tax=Actinomadura sp. OS1-43 TaxID=604315 RepID=UPI00255B1572|nr:hypothetical protein [Actinomadura sp. OS1-43]MDL4812751.1 hypothetical protein [Actinomadura sp. OS1-43]
MTDTPSVRPATRELLALVREAREDIDLREVEAVIAEALAVGKPWPGLLVQTARMVARLEGPDDLWNAINDPIGLNPAARRRAQNRRPQHPPERTLMPETPTPRPRLVGPHCPHGECSWHTCNHTGYAEYPCRAEGCEICGAPPTDTPEHWGGDAGRYAAMSPEEQQRVRAHWERYPLLRRATDTTEVIPGDRAEAAARVIGGQ